MRTIVDADRLIYTHTLSNNRDGRVFAFERMGTCAIAIRFFPAWIMDSSVYVKSDTMFMRSAASRVYARKPLVVSGTRVFDTCRTTQLPRRCRRLRVQDKCLSVSTLRSPMTTSAAPLTSRSEERRVGRERRDHCA